MKFDTPATTNPIDQLKVVGKPVDRIDGPLKTTGTAPYAYERHDVAPNQAYGYVVGAAIAKGRIASMDLTPRQGRARRARHRHRARTPASSARASSTPPSCSAGPEIEHYHQAIALVVAETFEQARAAAQLVRVDYDARARARSTSPRRRTRRKPAESIRRAAGNRGRRLRRRLRRRAGAARRDLHDARRVARDDGAARDASRPGTATSSRVWTSNQMIAWGVGDMAKTLGIPKENVRLISPYIGGGFGGKLFAARRRAAGRARRARRAAAGEGGAAAAADAQQHHAPAGDDPAHPHRRRDATARSPRSRHESWSGDLPGGKPGDRGRSRRACSMPAPTA